MRGVDRGAPCPTIHRKERTRYLLSMTSHDEERWPQMPVAQKEKITIQAEWPPAQ
jgi:hypothetical protein